jgi:hypothetical protein
VGDSGVQGLQGIQGIVGDSGVQGLQGIQGIVGSTGVQGLQGLQGRQGTQGLQGRQGTQGIQGLQGRQGTQGIIGSGLSITNYGDNRVLTSDGTIGGAVAETGLLFNGNGLTVNTIPVSLSGHTHNITDINSFGSGINSYLLGNSGILLSYNNINQLTTISTTGLQEQIPYLTIETSPERINIDSILRIRNSGHFVNTVISDSATAYAALNSGWIGSMTPASYFSYVGRSFDYTDVNRSAFPRVFYGECFHNIPSGIYNSGNGIGMQLFTLRNQATTLAQPDAGYLQTMYGITISYGHAIAYNNVNPITDTAYGLVISPSRGHGTINDAYDLFFSADAYGSGTITNHYGIYQQQANNNYFAGNIGIGTNAPSVKLDIDGNKIRLRSSHTPVSSSGTGNTGDIAWDNGYLYVCVATNTWKRANLSTW